MSWNKTVSLWSKTEMGFQAQYWPKTLWWTPWRVTSTQGAISWHLLGKSLAAHIKFINCDCDPKIWAGTGKPVEFGSWWCFPAAGKLYWQSHSLLFVAGCWALVWFHCPTYMERESKALKCSALWTHLLLTKLFVGRKPLSRYGPQEFQA